VHGEVSEVDRAGRVRDRSRLSLRFTSVVIDGRANRCDQPGALRRLKATKKQDATKIGAGAGIGAAIGGYSRRLRRGQGAVIGGAAGTGPVLATRGKEVELASGPELNPTLASPVEVEVK
jgi:hypothetical protein